MTETQVAYLESQTTGKGITVIPSGFREYTVCQDGRVVCTCSGRNSQSDARKIANALVALDEVVILERRIEAMTESIKPNMIQRLFGVK